MTRALIQVNGTDGSDDDLPIDVLVQLNNDGNGGELTYLWSILDQPPGSADALSSATIQNPTITPKKEGTYLFQLIVNNGDSDQRINTAIAGIRQIKSRERVPAAFESLEDGARGWAGAGGSLLQRLDATLADPGILVASNQNGGTVNAGDVVLVSSSVVLKSGLPGQETIPGVAKAPSNAAGVFQALYAVVSDLNGNTASIANGVLVKCRAFGRVGGVSVSGGSVGDPMYVNDSAAISQSPGTYRRRIGSIEAIVSSVADVWLDGGPTRDNRTIQSASGPVTVVPWLTYTDAGSSAPVTHNLPAAPSLNDEVDFYVDSNGITIQAAGSQIIRYNGLASSAGGTLFSTTVDSTVKLRYVATNKWAAMSSIGLWGKT